MKGLKAAVENSGGNLYAVLSPMMACEEAWLLGQAIRAIDPQATLVLGPVPTANDEVFKHSITGQQTFVIKGEKVPNAAGIRRVMGMLGGPTATWEEFSQSDPSSIKAGWIVGGYLSKWVTGLPPVLSGGFKVVQDLLPTAISESADVILPAAAWAEKDGCWENYAGRIQPFTSAVAPPEGVMREGDVYLSMLGRPGLYRAPAIRAEMGEPFAAIAVPEEHKTAPAMEFVEL
jgi:NADH-quinone oxidoreductase subunit G